MSISTVVPGVQHVHVNGVRIAYQDTGKGEPLVLVHGSWGSHHNWDPLVPGLSVSHRVVCYDRRGHSQSERPARQGTFAEDVTDLAALVEALDACPAWVVGSSAGAVITLQLAAARPDLLRGVIVHEPPLWGVLPRGSSEASAYHRIQTGLLAEVLGRIGSGDHAGAAELFVDEVAFGPGSWERLPEATRATMVENAPTFLDEERAPDSRSVEEVALSRYRGPVLLTFGTQSPPVFQPVLQHLARLLPQARSVAFVGAGHIPHVTHPGEYVSRVRGFVAAHGSGGAS